MNKPATPEPIYIPDNAERLMMMLVDEAFDWLVKEVEEETKNQDK